MGLEIQSLFPWEGDKSYISMQQADKFCNTILTQNVEYVILRKNFIHNLKNTLRPLP